MIGLGKHGGQELNYSSDIDPIFLYDPETLPHREREDVADSAVRIGKRVIELLSAARRTWLCLSRRYAAAAFARSHPDHDADRGCDQLL